MTKRVAVLLGCDMEEGREAEDVLTVSFAVDGGDQQEIELCSKHREYFRELSEHSRRAGLNTRKRVVNTAQDKDRRDRVRQWAQANPELVGGPVGKNGALPARATEAYEKHMAAANGSNPN